MFTGTVQNSNIQNQYYLNAPQYRRIYYTEPKQESIIPEDAKPLITFGILQTLTVLLQKASKWCGDKLMQGKEFTSPENIEKAADHMLSSNNLKDKINVEYITKKNAQQVAMKYGQNNTEFFKILTPVANGENAFYADGLKLAVAPKSKPSLILHELGHAVNANKGKFLKFLQKSKSKIANLTPALLLLNSIIPKEKGKKTFLEKYAGLIGFGAFLPTIIEEGIASVRGVNAAKKIQQTVDKTIKLKPLKRNYFFAWMTYLIAGLVFGTGVHLNMMDFHNK